LAKWHVGFSHCVFGVVSVAFFLLDHFTTSTSTHAPFSRCREKDIDEVLQTMAIFSNVSKGVLAKREDLLEAFGTDDESAICLKILAEGELQVSDKERKVELDTLFRDVASILSEKCVNSETNRPYTISMLERALRDVHFSVDPKRPAKAQALEALPLLRHRFPIERARMRLKMLIPLDSADELNTLLSAKAAVMEERDLVGNLLSVVCLIDPGAFRAIHALVQGAGGGGRVEVLALAATTEDADATAGIEDLSLGGRTSLPAGATFAAIDSNAVIAIDEPARSSAVGSSGFMVATSSNAATFPRRSHVAKAAGPGSSNDIVLYPRGPVTELPEEHASRKERFAELDNLEAGWTVELRSRGEGAPVDAVFYSPAGERVGAFTMARRMALQAQKQSLADKKA
jgi:ribosome maturation protein SDO1